MDKHEVIKKEIEDLLQEGAELHNKIYNEEDDTSLSAFFSENYQAWYTKALYVIKQIIPEREADFIEYYKRNRKRDDIVDTAYYPISDAFMNIRNIGGTTYPTKARKNVYNQVFILKSAHAMVDSKLRNIETFLQATLLDSEIESAKYLLKQKFIRPAGVIAGVVLEQHFKTICNNRNIKIKKNAQISDYNEMLKSENVYDVIEWRKIQSLGDIRNLCAHDKDREPKKEEVEDLIAGVERVIKNIF